MSGDIKAEPGAGESHLAGSGGGGDWSGGGLDDPGGPTGETMGTGSTADSDAGAGPSGAGVADPEEYAGEPGGSQVAGLPGEGDVASGGQREAMGEGS